MTYKPEREQKSYESGDKGIGKIRFSTDGKKVQVVLSVSTGKDQSTEKKYVLDVEDCPPNILQAKNAKEWAISMSSQGDKLMSFRPVNGVFIGTTKAFASKEGEEPVTKTKEVDMVKDKRHIHFSYEQFTVLVEILEPEAYKGLVYPLVLHYNIKEKQLSNGKSTWKYSMSGKYTDALEEYMLVAGLLEDNYANMEYKDNLLPQFQRIALHEGKKFQFTAKNGWIVSGSLIPFDEPAQEEIPFDETEETEIDDNPPFEVDDGGDDIDFEPDFEV